MANNLSIKLLMLGDSSVGKTCLLQRFTENCYTGQYKCTVGLDLKVHTVEIGGNRVKLHIYDTAGAERFRSMMSCYYRHVDGIILVFDLTNRHSYRHVSYWLDEIRKYATGNIHLMLVGNKCDEDGRQVCQDGAASYASSLDMPYMEASAMTGHNVERLFFKLAVSIYDEVHMKQHKVDKQCPDDDKHSVILRRNSGLRNFCC
ncbi:GTP-binding protein ypt2 [Drosophila grimshawi]|uniref:GH12019 n=1 Tax=Drosophila grimshawi TaxID=7222 RepID=B4JKP5_DROGR|nr:GTP-binding protein ypt2 [Drosophila grimshawi]EDW00148.1 GH12019 [Drosophila grimshawi]